MNNILIYCREIKSEPKSKIKSEKKSDPKSEKTAAQTAGILSEQLQHLGLHVEISHALNFPRLLLNSYQTVHYIIENLPLTVNEAFYFSICKALGKSTILSVLNSEKKQTSSSFLDFIRPDAFSVSQTNHLKLYRHITGNKFIFPGFPKAIGAGAGGKNNFKAEAFLIPLQTKIEEAFEYRLAGPIYFDGRKLLKAQGSSQLRKKWNELITTGKITPQHHLVLSDSKLLQLINEESLAIVLADLNIINTEFTTWLSAAMNKNNLIILNDFQATGFSNYWTSGHNCLVVSAQNWKNQLADLSIVLENSLKNPLENASPLIPTSYITSELFEPTVNELSRLYAKLWQQKTSLLTSSSVKL